MTHYRDEQRNNFDNDEDFLEEEDKQEECEPSTRYLSYTPAVSTGMSYTYGTQTGHASVPQYRY